MTPVLWHIPISHFSEKVRWALAHKGVEHERRAPLPGAHIAVALWLTRGRHRTLPVLGLDGLRIGDSTAIIDALEERYPEPALYPADPAERSRALELEEFFDEELGPYIRRLVWHEAMADRDAMGEIAVRTAPKSPLARAPRLASAYGSALVSLRYGAASERGADEARGKVLAAFDRLEAELDGRDNLVGDAFMVADLTAASLLYPVVLPPEAPHVISEPPPALERFRAPLKERPGYRWVEETFRKHRRRA
jgi:glutathione S-transferase